MELRLCLRLHARLPPAVPPPFPAPAALPASLRLRTGGSYSVTLRRRARRSNPAIRAAIADGAQVVAVKERTVSVILLSGGQGKRMGASMPKQYLPLLGLPIALHSLKTFCQLKEVKEVVVVCEPDYIDVFEGSIEDLQIPIKFARPGKERQDSVFNGLQEIDGDSELVCVHDSARPLVSSEDVKKVMKPNLLKDGFELVKRDGLEVTDDVSIVEYLKHPVYITEGSYTNIKVTTPDDMLLAERLMSEA
nr:unnamed protein product [Digitaria exilis]